MVGQVRCLYLLIYGVIPPLQRVQLDTSNHEMDSKVSYKPP